MVCHLVCLKRRMNWMMLAVLTALTPDARLEIEIKYAASD